ncbi:heat-inducible transcription repressor HrcA [Desulfovibrio sp. X2]|uniref:heat-inducible transcriptional repressor HrcA n=1 Tax=Desulfovibrio sp. X2 TaxID=941449 RepID=UPI0003588B86|nr:heat-inducible transcriptional repressor HrcA [Desulfovibrio sp. X2]EPR41463.1 heat-inducible transcription repressor HrcA [Desulfovibrio sp. X2]
MPVLNERETRTLTTIIELYIETAQPVGSRTVSRASGLGLSPASIRNVMADLTEKGYLEQPHTSAGRVPSALAFELYLEQGVRPAFLSEPERRIIVSSLGEAAGDISDLLRQACRLLSGLSKQVCMVMAPMQGEVCWKRIEFALIKPTLVMVILVLQGGLIQKKLVELERPVTSDDLVRYANYLNDLFTDKTVSQVRAHLLREMERARSALSEYFTQALRLASETVAAESERELFVEGAVNVISQPEFAGPESIRRLLSMLEERTRLLDILDRVMESGGVLVSLDRLDRLDRPDSADRQEGIDGLMGGEPFPGLSVIARPYGAQGQAIGVIGLLGPMRMNYAGLMPVVSCTADAISDILRKRF